ncbi:hypothetical protein V6V47_14955 [Micromonospora sp. CPCC 205539]|uniref:hypothetical protein n=1 Tax=Micromonospora sp. CPCC 205539 TaxID=3122408 RepID=UPI002FF3E281
MRETLSHQVAVTRPLSADPAGQAIRRANRVRRRRAGVGLALAAATTVLISASVAQLGGHSGRPPSPIVVIGDPYSSGRPIPSASSAAPAPAPGTSLDFLVSGALTSADGERLPLPGIGPAEHAHLLPDGAGWLVVGAPTAAGRSLWVAQRDGLVQVLLAGAGPITIAADGRQVAWRDGSGLLMAGVVGTQLIGPVRTPAPVDAVPVRFVGDSVLVRLDPNRPGHTLWQPGVGELTTGADRKTLSVYGALPDGRLVGQVSGADPRQTCLALLDPQRDLRPVRTGCGPELSPDGVGGTSPDGRWLLVNGTVGKAGRSLLVDLGQLGSDVTALPVGPSMVGTVSWTTDSAATYIDGEGKLVRVDVDRVRAGQPAAPAPVPGVQPGERPVLVTGS